jgi:hypothetical protein
VTKARDIADFKFENIVDTGTEGTKVALGTTAQRGSTTGQIRFNSTNNLAEYYDGTQFKSIDAPPTVTSISPTTQTDANANIVITGSNFASGATVKFVGADNTEYTSPSVTVNSATQITATTPSSALTVANEPYDIKVTNTSGLTGTLADALDAGGTPTWSTSAGNIATVEEGASLSTSISATDPDGQTVSYSETGGTVLSTNGFTLNSSTGAITGTAPTVSGNTTLSFTGRASDGTNIADRVFNIIVNDAPTGGTITSYTYNSVNYKVHTFTSNGSFVLSGSRAVDIFVLGGGGAGGGGNASNHGAGGGAGGLLWRPSKTLSAATYTITVGQGGAWSDGSINAVGGNNSIFTGSGYTLTGLGGGGGSGTSGTTPSSANGGSGGGAGRDAGSNAAGQSTQTNSEDSSAYAYGNNGGTAGGTSCTSAGGGGGTGQAGHNGGYDCQSNRNISGEQSEGGDGVNAIQGLDSTAFSHFLWSAQVGTDDTDSGGNQTGALLSTLSSRPSVVRIGGGGGGAYETDHASQLPYGGKGGGGRGGSRYPNGGGQAGYSGHTNTGSGGGAGQRYNGGGVGGSGGSGVVIVRYTV